MAGPTWLIAPYLAVDAGVIIPLAGPQPRALYAGLVWNAGRLLPRPPRKLPTTTTDADYCLAHRVRIYSDLSCQFCRERPAPHIAVPSDSDHAT